MPVIISRGSGHDARRRVVRMQRAIINDVNKYHETDKVKAEQLLTDFELMSKSSGVFKHNENNMKWVTTFERKEQEKNGNQETN